MSLKGFATVHGTAITFRRIVTGAYNTTTGTASTTETDVTTAGVLSDYRTDELDDTVQLGDRKLLIDGGDLAANPTTEDVVLIGSNIHRIVRVRPAGTEISQKFATQHHFELTLRGGE